ncbi:uncharacterized protein LOC133181131 [Saccostrea echinata]|uniref:uncharacterized protein LOC133181131 n=1 Tax=Saccostrea echinata TaxID=191078 RepID=UPI002A80C922|nr:uncharacterized protein LOC133181131 [Saccostrea echinata]
MGASHCAPKPERPMHERPKHFYRRPKSWQVQKFSWLTDLDEQNTNVAVDVDEFARVHVNKQRAVMVSRDRQLRDTEFDKHHTMFDFATGKIGIRFKFRLPPAGHILPGESAEDPADADDKNVGDIFEDGDFADKDYPAGFFGGFNRIFRSRPVEVCFIGDSLVNMTQAMEEFERRQMMVEIETGARAAYSVAAANKLTSDQLKALSPAIARFCCRAAKLDNVYQLTATGIVGPSTSTLPSTSSSTSPSTTTTTTQPTTTGGGILPNRPFHPGLIEVNPPSSFLASGFMNPANPSLSIPFQISLASDVGQILKNGKEFNRRKELIGMQSVAVCLSFFSVVVYGYPTGAPAGVCQTMVPGHGAAVQTGPSPYRVTMNTTSYTAGDRIMVTVSGGTFRGLLVEARPANCSTVTFPTFSLMVSESNLQTLACNGVPNSAITHTNRNDKTEANFYWTPSSSLGHVYFRATVVQVFNTYWVGIQSPVLRDNNSTDPVPDPICQIDTTAASTTLSTTTTTHSVTTSQTGGSGGNSGNNAGADLKLAVSPLIIMLVALFLII